MTGPVRDVQQSMFADHAPDRPVGTGLGSVYSGNNAQLIAAAAPLYLTGSVMDVTYGRGGWWTRFQPDPFTSHDLATDGVDFRALPELDSSYDAVCFDPPYVPAGGTRTSGATQGEADYRNRFGLEPRSHAELVTLIDAGMAEVARVARGWVLAKCCDYVSGGKFYLGHVNMVLAAERHGLAPHDLIVHHTGSGPGGHNIFTSLRARRHHSYLLVFKASA